MVKDSVTMAGATLGSIIPVLVPYSKAIQRFAAIPPLGHKAVHQGDEAAVVGGLQQVGHFMHHDVFQAFPWLPGQIGIEPDACGAGATATPFGFHPLHKEPLHLHAHERLPFRDQRRDCFLELRPIPFFEDRLVSSRRRLPGESEEAFGCALTPLPAPRLSRSPSADTAFPKRSGFPGPGSCSPGSASIRLNTDLAGSHGNAWNTSWCMKWP